MTFEVLVSLNILFQKSSPSMLSFSKEGGLARNFSNLDSRLFGEGFFFVLMASNADGEKKLSATAGISWFSDFVSNKTA